MARRTSGRCAPNAARNVGGSNTLDPNAGGIFSNGSLTFTVTVGEERLNTECPGVQAPGVSAGG